MDVATVCNTMVSLYLESVLQDRKSSNCSVSCTNIVTLPETRTRFLRLQPQSYLSDEGCSYQRQRCAWRRWEGQNEWRLWLTIDITNWPNLIRGCTSVSHLTVAPRCMRSAL